MKTEKWLKLVILRDDSANNITSETEGIVDCLNSNNGMQFSFLVVLLDYQIN